MPYNAMPYLFVRGHENQPNYQINSDGQLFRFEKGVYIEPSDKVLISAVEVRSLLCPPLDRAELWLRCNKLYARRKEEKKRAAFFSSSEEFRLSLLLEEAWRTLNQ
jgi:hypothetical protein